MCRCYYWIYRKMIYFKFTYIWVYVYIKLSYYNTWQILRTQDFNETLYKSLDSIVDF